METVKDCINCSHRQNYDNEDRCSYYNDSLCSYVIKYCKQEHFMDVSKGISLYALKSWLKRLNKDEMEIPLRMTNNNEDFIPLLVIKSYCGADNFWKFYCLHQQEFNKKEKTKE